MSLITILKYLLSSFISLDGFMSPDNVPPGAYAVGEVPDAWAIGVALEGVSIVEVDDHTVPAVSLLANRPRGIAPCQPCIVLILRQ
jgi:hypothetical protein